MKSKTILSSLLAVLLLCGSVSASFEAIAANSVSVDSFIDSVEELNVEEADEEKTLEESVASRVIVKSLQKPPVYGNAEYYKGTYGKHVFQYTTEQEAREAVDYYSSLSNTKYAVCDGIAKAQVSSYGEAMLGTQRAVDYIENNELQTSVVKVAVLDTGINFNDALFSDNPRIIDSGVNLTNTGSIDTALDDNFHGSVCTEIIMNNSCESTMLTGYKVLNAKGVGTYLWIASGVEKAVEDGANIINLSLGGEAEPFGYESSAVLDDAVEYAISKGVIVVVAAGNDGVNAKYISPANIDGAITVGAIDQAGNHAYFSNYGDCVDFVAPGVAIFSEYKNEEVNGTSFSAPYIASEVSIILSVFPTLTREQVYEKLREVCIPYEHLSYHDGFHPIEEDKGVRVSSVSLILKYELVDDNSIYYSYGMPQADLIFNEIVREDSPVFSIESGHYIDEEFDLIISSSPSAEIYYTQDESYPTKENGIKYDGSIHLDELQSIRAIAFSDNKAPSFFSAREYNMEYHVPESNFTIIDSQKHTSMGKTTYYKNVITEYRGTRKNIICPDSVDGKSVEKFDIRTPNVRLTSITLPDSCKYISIVNTNGKYTKDIVRITGNGLNNLTAYGKYFPALVEINAPNLVSVNINESFVRSLYLPKATHIHAYASECLKSVYAPSLTLITGLGEGHFQNCFSLQDFYAPNVTRFGDMAFCNCVKLRNFNMEKLERIDSSSLSSTYSITGLYCPSLTEITGTEPLPLCNATYLYAPKLKSCSQYIGHKTCVFSDRTFDYSEHTVKFIVSSEWSYSEQDGEGYDNDPLTKEDYFYHYNVDIYGTPKTFAEEYANQFNLRFVALPLLESEPENMGHQSDGNITTDVLGFNKEYQWYGTGIKDNRLGIAIQSETEETMDTSKYDYNYYYCVVKTHDGDYKKDIVTGTRKTLDMNGDGVIDIGDISLLLSQYGNTPEKDYYDVSENGIVDIQDITYLLYSTVYGTKE